MKKVLVSLALGAAFVSAPAMAQDAGTFTGPRVEGVIGYDMNKAGSSIDDDSDIDNDESAEGLLYGVGVGYDIDAGNFVFGPEAEITWSSADTDFEDGDFEGFGVGNVNVNRDIYVGARAGFKVAPTTLAYVKGGYTNAKYDIRSAFGNVETNRDLDADGWRVGAGVEQQFGSNTYAKLEYRYSNYSEGEIDYTGDYPDGSRFDVDLDRHQIVAGVGVRF